MVKRLMQVAFEKGDAQEEFIFVLENNRVHLKSYKFW